MVILRWPFGVRPQEGSLLFYGIMVPAKRQEHSRQVRWQSCPLARLSYLTSYLANPFAGLTFWASGWFSQGLS